MEIDTEVLKAAQECIIGTLGGGSERVVDAIAMILYGSALITSNPPPGDFKVINLYVSSSTGKLVVDYENN